ncbi:MAG: hypothetical protein QW429_05935 [Thermoprotei archaeon]
MFELTEQLEFRLNNRVLGVLLNPLVIVEGIENPSSVSKKADGAYSVVVKKLMGSKTLALKVSVEGDGGRVVCEDDGAPRWVYSVVWRGVPGSATVELVLSLKSDVDGLKSRAKRLLEDLKVHILNGDVEEAYSRILSYFKDGYTAPQNTRPGGSAEEAKKQPQAHSPAERVVSALKLGSSGVPGVVPVVVTEK